MKILLSTNTSRRVLEVLESKINFLKKEGHEVHVICSRDFLTSKLKKRHKNIHFCEINRNKISPLNDLFLLFKYWKLYKKINPDLIFHSTIKPNIYGSIIASYLKINCVTHISGIGSTINKNSIFNYIIIPLYKFSQKKVRKVLFQNFDDKKFFIEKNIIKKSQASLLPTAFDFSRLNNMSKNISIKNKNKFRFLYVGRLIKEKGIFDFLIAAEKLSNQSNKVEFFIIGNLDFSGFKKNSIFKKFQLKDNFTFINYSDKILEYIDNADCVVVPSWREGMSNVLIEAGAMKKPSIASDVPGCKDVITNGYNGYLFKPKVFNEIIYAMNRILNDSNIQRKEMGLNAHNNIRKKFRFKDLELFYENLLISIN